MLPCLFIEKKTNQHPTPNQINSLLLFFFLHLFKFNLPLATTKKIQFLFDPHRDNIFCCANENAGGSDGVPAYAKFDQNILFFDYRIEARADNTICLSMKPAHFLRATRALKDTPEITLALTKKRGNAKLTLTAKDTRGVDYVQDIPVTVLPPDEHDRTDEPMLSVPEKIVTFKDPMALKTVVDRMKGFDKFLTVTAFPTERLQLTVGTGIVDVTTQFAGLDIIQPPRNNDEDDDQQDNGNGQQSTPSDNIDQRPSIVRVDCKQLSQALGVSAIRHESISFCLTTDYVLIVYIKLHNQTGQFTLYLQSAERENVMDESDDEEGDDVGQGQRPSGQGQQRGEEEEEEESEMRSQENGGRSQDFEISQRNHRTPAE